MIDLVVGESLRPLHAADSHGLGKRFFSALAVVAGFRGVTARVGARGDVAGGLVTQRRRLPQRIHYYSVSRVKKATQKSYRSRPLSLAPSPFSGSYLWLDMGEALRLVADTQPDLAVIDISLKTGNGLDLIKRIADRTDAVRILVWSTHSESLCAERSLRAGALGYINKDQATDRIIEAIRRVLEGKIYLSDAMTEKMLHRAVGDTRPEVTRSPLDARGFATNST